MTEKQKEIHQKALSIASVFHMAESDLIDILQKVDGQRIFVRLGYGSLFDYATRALKLSEANASNFITVARKSQEYPELKRSVRRGEITVSKARKITPVLTKETLNHWLNLARELPKAKLEREVAAVTPQEVPRERIRYLNHGSLEMRLGISEETLKKLKRAQNILCQKTKASVSLEESIAAAVDCYLEKNDPIQKAERNVAKYVEAQGSPHELSENTNEQSAVKNTRRPLSAALKHKINFRDRGQCTHIDRTGRRCANERWIDFHHITPVSEGGANALENLTTLCSTHHKLQHLN